MSRLYIRFHCPLQHNMVMKLDSNCYLMKLDDTEAVKVHDAAGIVEIEVLIRTHPNPPTPFKSCINNKIFFNSSNKPIFEGGDMLFIDSKSIMYHFLPTLYIHVIWKFINI